MSTFGEKIRRLRLDRHFSQQRVANDLGLSQSAVAAFENCVNEPSFKMIEKFADYYHVPPNSILPFDTKSPDEETTQLAETIMANPKLKVLFDRATRMTDADLDAVDSILRAISRERDA